MAHTLGLRMETAHCLMKSRSHLGRKSLCFGRVGTDEQEDTSLSIYYQAILSPSRKAVAFVIYDDSHLGSISFSHFVPPTWKEMFIQWLICKGASEERWCVDQTLPCFFSGWVPVTHSWSSVVGRTPQNLRKICKSALSFDANWFSLLETWCISL